MTVHTNTPTLAPDSDAVLQSARSNEPARDWQVEELARVTDEELTRVLGRRFAKGWSLERIDYIKEVGVRRPQMAFLFFSRAAGMVEATADDVPAADEAE